MAGAAVQGLSSGFKIVASSRVQGSGLRGLRHRGVGLHRALDRAGAVDRVEADLRHVVHRRLRFVKGLYNTPIFWPRVVALKHRQVDNGQ